MSTQYFESVIYHNEVVVIYRCSENNLGIDTLKRKFIRCKTMKMYLYSLQPSSPFTFLRFNDFQFYVIIILFIFTFYFIVNALFVLICD